MNLIRKLMPEKLFDLDLYKIDYKDKLKNDIYKEELFLIKKKIIISKIRIIYMVYIGFGLILFFFEIIYFF